ncbi:hypothetical protein [Adhaeribacter aquaticus]|uniref:hypothetical protein n=1 Tax=Adhaeribacter aquaticus TaxID=299567 RepID=UPI00047E3890|nr:hypothetical protein [Adhaeribacter aquaticus]
MMLAHNNTINTALLNYLTNEDAIRAQYPNSFIILFERQILGPYQSVTEAYRVAFAKFELGTFIVKYCGKL